VRGLTVGQAWGLKGGRNLATSPDSCIFPAIDHRGSRKMPAYPYTLVTGKLKSLLQKVRSSGVPPKLTVAHLKTLGFASSNDSGMIGVLKFIGLTDGSGIPTPLWSEYRGQDHRAVLGKAIRKGYADLFAIYPDANTRSVADLAHVFSTSSTAGEQVVNKTVLTFKALVDEADFTDQGDSAGTASALATGPLHAAPAAAAVSTQGAPTVKHPAVHIDIQIHISPESSAEQIDKIFESMAKHLYGANSAAN
jgi:hypothetical protein